MAPYFSGYFEDVRKYFASIQMWIGCEICGVRVSVLVCNMSMLVVSLVIVVHDLWRDLCFLVLLSLFFVFVLHLIY